MYNLKTGNRKQQLEGWANWHAWLTQYVRCSLCDRSSSIAGPQALSMSMRIRDSKKSHLGTPKTSLSQ